MKKNIVIRLLQTVGLVLLPFALSGQNLDPTVTVSKTYEGKLMDMGKPHVGMAVPDSVLRFDLDFDYSVNDTPYRGSYEFMPHSVEMKPSASVRENNVLYMKAGAGYQLHPVFDLVWSPSFRKPFRMNVYASHRSFVGNYWKIEPSAEGVLDHAAEGNGRTWRGYDLANQVGLNGRYDWTDCLFRFDLSYDGILQEDRYDPGRSYNTFALNAGIASKNPGGLKYRADACYRYSNDRLYGGTSSFVGNDFEVDGALGYSFGTAGDLFLDLGAKFVSSEVSSETPSEGGPAYDGGDFDIVPHYVMNAGNWHFDLGVRISPAFGMDSMTYKYKEQVVYPDVRVEFRAIPDAMKVYMDFGGDCGVDSYSDMVGSNSRVNLAFGRGAWEIPNISDECIRAEAGLEGRIGYRFSYGLRGGYSQVGNTLLEGIVRTDLVDGGLLPAVGYASYSKVYAAADWLLLIKGFKFDGSVGYSYFMNEDSVFDQGLILPAALKGDVSFSYNWRKRLDVGVDCRFSTARKGAIADFVDGGEVLTDVSVPGYADLGVMAEYSVNRKLTVWARGDNLLGMTIQRSVLFAEKGPYFTAGICLKL